MDLLHITFLFTANQKSYQKSVRYEEPIHVAVYDLLEKNPELSELYIKGLSAKGRRIEMCNNYVTETIKNGDCICVDSDKKECVVGYHCKWKEIYNNGIIEEYNGYVANGKRDGKGVYVYSNGDMYKGDWKDDKREGKGMYKSNDGVIYEGDWKHDKREGKGIYKRLNCHIFCGIYEEDRP